MMDANEESEIFESMGRVSRTAAAGTMQAAETVFRRTQMGEAAKEHDVQDQQRHAETMHRLKDRDHNQEATLASMMRKDSYNRDFWRYAGPEKIADYVTASAHLAPRHAEARSAHTHMSDVLRNDYGINTSLVGRHYALRDALHEYFARHRRDAEADESRDQQESATIDGEAARAPEAQDSSVDNSQSRGEAAQAYSNKADLLADAQQHTGEARRDMAPTRAEEVAGVRQPHPYQRSSDADLAAVGERNPQAASVRSRTRQNFPQSSKQRIFSARVPSARQSTSGRSAPSRDLEAGR